MHRVKLVKMALLWYNYSIWRKKMTLMPIKELKNTAHISALCHESPEPIFITKNGYGDMVIMSMKAYEERLNRYEIYDKLAEAEEDITEGSVLSAKDSLSYIRNKYNV